MRRIAILFMLLSFVVIAAQPSRAQGRPRRVGQTAGPAPVESPAPTPDRPPVLGGVTTGRSGNAQQTPTPAPNGSNEVGEGDVVKVNTTLVSVPVTVLDRDGKYVPDLRQGDFRIFEDGVEQQVSYFASVEKPFTVVLMLDTSGSTHFKLEDIQDGAIAFVDQLRPDDRVMVVSFDDRIRVLSEPTNDRSALRSAIRRSRSGNGTRLYDAVDFVIKQYINHISGRKAIVLFTDGVDTTSRHATYQTTVRQAEELDALIYTVDFDTYQDVSASGGGGGSSWPYPRRQGPSIFRFPFPMPFPVPGGPIGRGGGGGVGAGSSREEYETADAYLHELSQKTGARFYQADTAQNMAESFRLVAEELRRQYSLGYYPKITAQAGQRRQIRVRVNRPNLAVRARDSYLSDPRTGATAQDNQTHLTGRAQGQDRLAARVIDDIP